MRLSDAALLLVGSRRAILAVWRDRWALVVGALLVLSASLARNYDGHDLVREWTVFTHGFAASIVNAFLMYALMAFVPVPQREGRRSPFWSGFLSFLGVFWMTAPMAWLYGIPWEYMLPAESAVLANIWTLVLVAIWRLWLIVRVFSVMFNVGWVRPLIFVLFVSNAVAIVAMYTLPMPLIDIMGGLRHPPEQLVLTRFYTFGVMHTFLAIPFTLVAMLIALGTFKPPDVEWPPTARASAPVGVLTIACLAIAGWLIAALWAQPPVRRKMEVEWAVAEQRYDDAAGFLLAHPPREFPPVWDLPPRRKGYIDNAETRAPVFAILAAIEARGEIPDWIAYAYGRKLLYSSSHSLDIIAANIREGDEERIRWVMTLEQLATMCRVLEPVAARLDGRESGWYLEARKNLDDLLAEGFGGQSTTETAPPPG